MRIKYLFITFCLFCLTTRAQKTTQQDPSITEIEKVMAMQEQAWNEGDIDKFMEGYWNSDSLCFVGQSGLTYGWKQTLANYKKNYPNRVTMGKLTFILVKKEKLGPESYLVSGKWHLTRKDEVGGHFSLVWKKIKGHWVIISDHTS